MPTFAFQARDARGQLVNGTREATDRQQALVALRDAGLFVTELAQTRSRRQERPPQIAQPLPTAPVAVAAAVAPVAVAERPGTQPIEPRVGENPPPSNAPVTGVPRVPGQMPSAVPEGVKHLKGRANAKEMSLYFRQLHAMLNAGTSLVHSLRTLSEHASNKALREASLEMRIRIEGGMPWSQTMRAFPGLFSPLMIGMVAAGESGGFLDRMCLKLSEYSERDYELQQTIKRETWYPKLLVLCSFLIPSAVPLVLASVQGGNPLVAWLQNIVPPAVFFGVLWLLWKTANYASPVVAHEGSPRYWIDAFKLRVPIVGKIVRALATAKFCRSLGALQSAGAGLHKTIALAADSCGNTVIAQSVRSIIPHVEAGEGLTNSLAKTGQLSPIALQMLSTGEMSGDIETQLDKVADFLEGDAETAIKQGIKVLGIVVFLLIAINIGSQVVKFWGGYFNQAFDMGEKLSD